MSALRDKLQAQFADLAVALDRTKAAPLTQLRQFAGDLAYRQTQVFSTMAAALLEQENKIDALTALAEGRVLDGK